MSWRDDRAASIQWEPAEYVEPWQRAEPVTDDEKRERMEAFLTAGHCEYSGQEPYASRWVGRTFVVATYDDHEGTGIDTYRQSDLLRWFDRAAAFMRRYGHQTTVWQSDGREHPAYDFDMACHETAGGRVV
jgi:hypothetical protein